MTSAFDAVPAQLRPPAARFGEHMLTARRRAHRAGTKPRTDHTIETALSIVRDLARFLASQMLRCTRLADLVNTMDPKLVPPRSA